MSKKNIIISLSAVLLIIVILMLPVTVPMTIDVPCKISPASKWFVELGNDGNVLTSLHNAQSGSIENYFSAVPERGDTYVFKLIKNPSDNWVEQGDTIGIIHSSLLSQEYAALQGRFQAGQANLKILMSGEKASIVKHAQEQLNAAKENADYQNKIYSLKNDLYKKNLISFEENELYRSQARQAEIDVAVKQAYLESIETGGKQEQINLVKDEIRSLKEQLQVLNEKKNSHIIVTPIKGIVNSYNSADTILTVSSPNSILFIPLAWRFQPLIKVGMQVELNMDDGRQVVFHVSKITNDIQKFNGTQVLTLIAASEQSNLGLPDNLWTACTLNLGEVSLYEFLIWKLSQTYEV